MTKPLHHDTLYPADRPRHPLHPSSFDFEVVPAGEMGEGLRTLRPWKRGERMARFDGTTSPSVQLHTLQKSVGVHLHDPHFIGMLLHSCDPLVMLDMQEQEMWALKDIPAGVYLTMDYASTEDRLFRTFECGCGSANCRGVITGRKQAP